MGRFDTGAQEEVIEKVIGLITHVLMSPFYWLWTSWMSKNLPNVIENMFFILNSCLWGVAIEYGYSNYKMHGMKIENST